MKILITILLIFCFTHSVNANDTKNYLVSKHDKYCSYASYFDEIPETKLFERCFNGYNFDVTIINLKKSTARFRTTNIFLGAILKMYCDFDKEIITKFPNNDNYDGFISCIYKKK